MLMNKRDRQKEQILKGVIVAGGAMIIGSVYALFEMRDETIAMLKDYCDRNSKNINEAFTKIFELQDKLSDK